ncbi:sensor histidine kinase [Paenibacillus tuaregi]|uniref:sensor histidine kinase n=1 Tax=Paenibacillus tuaregi TaxID=1816681 RepID=UPI000838EE23|nr:HAMP domain-containing sensor histidine kinase [Paenibacillus tuaregi]
MRTLRIRSFMILCLVVILFLPWIFFVTAHFMETNTINFTKNSPRDEKLQRQLTDIIHQIEVRSDQWMDSKWQSQLHKELQLARMDAVILTASDEEIYSSNPDRKSASLSTERFSILEDGHIIGKVILYLPNVDSRQVQVISAFLGLLLAFLIIGIGMRRLLLKPLEKMSLGARQIAVGDWSVQLPLSRITEIKEVRDGYEVMVNGLQQAYQKQTELEAERKFVIAAVAHDLRTPLFALRGYLDGLEQGIAQSPDKIAKYVAVCKEKSTQLDRLVEELFTFTKMEYLETKLNSTAVDLSLILRKSMDSLGPLAQHKNIPVSIHSAGDCTINGDAHLVERAMNNLLDNAVRHTPAHGKITIECSQDGDHVKFSIRDSGPGFSSEELERVFEPLYRGEVSRNRSTGGSGLGLTISQKIIRRHGGELTAHNHPDGGALLTGWFPVNG